MGPTVWELDGPIPIEKPSNTLTDPIEISSICLGQFSPKQLDLGKKK
jgi:hypothetical protein